MLFNIFINDLMEGLEEISGVTVPWGERRTWASSDLRVAGALFADDAVGLCPTVEKVKLFCDRVTEWCENNEMGVGISKCGILEIRVLPDDEPTLTEEHPLRSQLRLCGMEVPLVSDYKYLGLTLTSTLDRQVMVTRRCESGRKTVGSLQPFLSCTTLALAMRLAVVKAVVATRMSYGSEVFGMNRVLTDRSQTVLNWALRMVAGHRGGKQSMPSAPLWAEFQMPPFCAKAAGLRARAFQKAFTLKSTIGKIMRKPLRSRRWTWSNGIPRWIKRHCAPFFAAADHTGDWETLTPSELRDLVQRSITIREKEIRRNVNRQTAAATRSYFNGGFGKMPLAKARVGVPPTGTVFLAAVLRARMRCIALAPEMVQHNRLGTRWRNRCPCCRAETVEDLHHLIFECRRHAGLRRSLLGKTLRAVEELEARWLREHGANHDSSNDGLGSQAWNDRKVAWILGGVQQSLGMRGFVPCPPEPDSEEEDNSSHLSAEDAGGSGGRSGNPVQNRERSHVECVGEFLVRAVANRSRLLGSASFSFGEGPGASATTTGQGPAG